MALLLSASSLVAPLPALAADITTQQTVTAGNTLTVNDGDRVTVNADPAVQLSGGPGLITVINSGTIESTAGGASRAIRIINTGGTTRNILITNNVGGIIQAAGDVIQSQTNIVAGSITINNSGTIRSQGTGGNNGQAIDLNNITTGIANGIVINNFATGVMTSADSDAIRAPNLGVINNYGLIMSNFATDPNGNDSGNDGIDFNDDDFSGKVNNFRTGRIVGARHGITAGQGLEIVNYGAITGNDGSGINIDSTTNASITRVTNYGAIIGNAKTADGDGIDVDRLLNLENHGVVRGVGTGGGGNLSEGLAIGGGIINNYAGALIYSDQRAITVDDSSLGNAFAAVTINNAGTIQGGNGEAIRIISILSNTLVNSGTIIGSVTMGSGDDTVTIQKGSKIVGLVDGAAGTDILNYNKVGLTEAKRQALIAGQTVNIGGTLYQSFETVSAATGSFSSFAANSATQGIAAIIDSIGGQVSLGVQTLIDRVASASDVNGALAQLTPTAFQSFTTFGISTSFQTAQLLGQRLDNARGGASSFDISGLDVVAPLLESDSSRRALVPGVLQPDDEPFGAFGYAPVQTGTASTMAFAAMNRGQMGGYLKAPGLAALADNPGGVFMYGHATFGRQGATANSPETRFTTAGLTVGIDRHMTQDLVAGVFGGFSRTAADLDTIGSTGNISTVLAGVYGSYHRYNMFANAAFIYGHNSYDNTRMALGTANTSSPDGDQFAVQGSVGADFRYGLWIVTPEVGVQYTTVRVDGFTETGLAALTVEADQADSLRTSLGMRTRYEWVTAWGLFIPEWRASWQHEFLDQERDVRASFVDTSLPGTFSTTAVGDGRDFGVIGAGIGKALSGSTLMSLNYDFKFGGHSLEAHQVSGRLRHTF